MSESQAPFAELDVGLSKVKVLLCSLQKPSFWISFLETWEEKIKQNKMEFAIPPFI